MPPPTEQTGSWARGPWRRLLLPELREAVDIHLAENADILERISRAMECVEGDDRDLDACERFCIYAELAVTKRCAERGRD